MNEKTIAGPAYCADAAPVSTKIPVPIMAPIPSDMRLPGPSARFRLCSPVSCASDMMRFRGFLARSEEHTSELQSLAYLVCRLLLEKKKKQYISELRSCSSSHNSWRL